MSNALAFTAVVVSLLAVGVAWWNGASARRSADAAEGSQHAADRAADAAKDSAESARRVAEAEVERDHDGHRPSLEKGTFEQNTDALDPLEWFYEYRFPIHRDYDFAAEAVFAGGARKRLEVRPSEQVRGGDVVTVQLNERRNQALPQRIKLLFWPPRREGESWTCPCGRALDPGETPHWELSVGVPTDLDYDIRDSLG